MTFEEKKKNLLMIFLGFLLLLLNLSFQISIQGKSVNFPYGAIIGIVLICLAAFKNYQVSNNRIWLFVFGGAIVTVVVSIVLAFTSLSYLPSDDFMEVFNKLAESSANGEINETALTDFINALTPFIEELIKSISVSAILTVLCNSLLYISTGYALAGEYPENNHAEKLKKISIILIVFNALTFAITLLLLKSSANFLKTIDIQNGVLDESGASKLALFAFLLVVVAIVYLVYSIKFVCRLYKIRNALVPENEPTHEQEIEEVNNDNDLEKSFRDLDD